MTVEAITYTNSLDPALPGVNDPLQIEGAAHIKGIKAAIKATLPNITGPVTATQTELNKLAGFAGAVRSTSPIAGELVLLSDVSVSSTPAAIDFVHGVGSVVIDATYDEYLLILAGLLPSTTAEPRVSFSIDAGATFTGAGQFVNNQVMFSNAGVAAHSQQVATTFLSLTNGNGVPITNPQNGIHGTLRIARPSTGPNWSWAQGDFTMFAGAYASRIQAAISNGTGRFNALRLSWSLGTFAAQGRVKLFGRKAS